MTDARTRTRLRRGLIARVRTPASGGVTEKELDLLLNCELPDASPNAFSNANGDDVPKKSARENEAVSRRGVRILPKKPRDKSI
jgi:hypothetical protein